MWPGAEGGGCYLSSAGMANLVVDESRTHCHRPSSPYPVCHILPFSAFSALRIISLFIGMSRGLVIGTLYLVGWRVKARDSRQRSSLLPL